MTDVTHNATAATERPQRPSLGAASQDPPRQPVVLIANRQTDIEVDAQRCRSLAQRVLKAEGAPLDSETAVAFVGPDEMADLNEIHMGHASPTDVLAFPLDLAADAHAASNAPTGCSQTEFRAGPVPVGPVPVGPVLVGDVVVCPAVAALNAEASTGSRTGHDGSVAAEIDLLVVHGVLHLLGMDHAHPTDAAVMRSVEDEHLRTWWARL